MSKKVTTALIEAEIPTQVMINSLLEPAYPIFINHPTNIKTEIYNTPIFRRKLNPH